MNDREPRLYVLPNLFTAGNMLCGFMALMHIVGRFDVNDSTSRYYWAIGLILLACILDALDGRIARMSGQSSDFGRELDSLADIVSFGVAPALLVHDIVLGDFERNLGGLGWMIACGYLVCGAMRLARFNCLAAYPDKDSKTDPTCFRGCPIPAAAGVIVSITLFLLWMNGNEREIGKWKYALPMLMVALSYLMVSNIEYPSFKGINWRTRRSMGWVIGSIFVIVFTVRHWQWMPMVLFVAYLAYGLVRPWISRRWRHELEDEDVEEIPADEAADDTSSAKKPSTGTQDPAASI